MANTWDTLPNEVKMKLARHMMEGKEQSPDNLNRAMKILSQDPNMVDKTMKECYPEDSAHQLQDTDPDQGSDEMATAGDDYPEERTIDDTVEEGLASEGESDVQQAGQVANRIPPPTEDENIQEYLARLMALMRKGGGKMPAEETYAGEEEELE